MHEKKEMYAQMSFVLKLGSSFNILGFNGNLHAIFLLFFSLCLHVVVENNINRFHLV
jgi:hypothetical protein